MEPLFYFNGFKRKDSIFINGGINAEGTYEYVKDETLYDLIVTTKSYNVKELLSMGAKRVEFVNNCFDVEIHRPKKISQIDKKKFAEKSKEYSNIGNTPDEKFLQIAKLDAVLGQFVLENRLDATAIQCWTSVQQNYGCNVCTSMSIMSENMLPSACEVDVTGTLTMYAMQLASNSPSALVDWNNNYADNEEKCVLFHCGNWAKSFLPDVKLSTAPILGTIVGEENTYGALEGRTPAFGTKFNADPCL